MQIIINAGGVGTRLWPLSTSKKPKQFVGLIDSEPLLLKTYKRLVQHFSPDQIWVNTNEKFKDLVLDCLPSSFDESHVLTEPSRRDNFPAIVSHAAVVANRTSDSEALVFVHADHFVPPHDWQTWNETLTKLGNAVDSREFDLMTSGVAPTFANNQLGYIELSPEEKEKSFAAAVKIQQFKEKPTVKEAQKFLDSGCFLWNLGYFSFNFKTLHKTLQQHWPLEAEITNSFFKNGEITPALYGKMTKIAFDYAIAEKVNKIGVIGMKIEWEDFGTWDIISKYLPEMTKNQVEFGGSGNLVKSDNEKRKVAFVGVSDLLVVENEEGILIINPKNSSEIKKVSQYFEI